MTILRIFLWAGFALVMLTTFLPLLHSNTWWVRVWDFPRLHIAVLAVLFAMAGLFFIKPALPFAVVLLACAIYQGWKIAPFTSLSKVEIELEQVGDRHAASFLAANVLQDNRDYEKTLDLVRELDPDVLLLMETDRKWEKALEPVLQQYTHVKSAPLDNYYGMVLATRLKVLRSEITYPEADDIPTILAEMEDRDGNRFFFIGLHPRPPVPGNPVEETDALIQRMANLTDQKELPVIAMGDFNVPAWSWTAHRFKHHGEYLDPRIGRGMLSSFHAKLPLLRFPIDQLYMTQGISLIRFGRTRAIGSDHFPMHAVLAAGKRSAK